MADNTLRTDKVESASRNDNLSDRDLNKTNPDANPDPITGAPGSHPIGTGVGAAAAGAAGAAIGSVVPGVGTVIGGAVGAVVGAVAGGYAGKGVAEAINPTEETAYWKDQYQSRPYYDQNTSFNEYEPAYRYGVESRCRYGENCPSYDQVESDLGRDWDRNRGSSSLSWDRAKHATRDAWHRASDRIERAVPGDSDRDGK